MPILTDTQLHVLARLGAITRLKELEEEAGAIRKAFPDLRQKQQAAAETAVPAADAAPRRRKRRSNMSPEARKAAAERMRAYWAKKKGETPSPETTAQAQDKGTAAPGAARKRATKRAAGKRAGRAKRPRATGSSRKGR